jgi:2-C-methyl-D-erythritol 4-phosphate cytidylyltransferase
MQSSERRRYAVIVAAGKGSRMGAPVAKQYLLMAGRPVLSYTLDAFVGAFPDITIVLVHAEEDAGRAREAAAHLSQQILWVRGGQTRFHSVKQGLAAVSDPAVVFVHDGARPLVSESLIRTCHQQALEKGSAVPALKLKESIRRLDATGNYSVDREAFRAIQTPQTFLSEILLPAFDQPYQPAFTDEASVVEHSGKPVHLIAGEEDNIKITRPPDLWLAEHLWRTRHS